MAPLVEGRVEGLGGESGRGHAAPIRGVEETGGVAGDQEVFGQTCPFVAAPPVGRAAVAVDWRNGLGVLYRVIDGGARESASELEESFPVRRRVVAAETDQDNRPHVALDSTERAAPGVVRPARQNGQPLPVTGEIFRYPYPAGRVAQPGIHDFFFGGFITELLEPARRAGALTARVYHEVGHEGLLHLRRATPPRPHSHDDVPAGIGNEAHDLAAREKANLWLC